MVFYVIDYFATGEGRTIWLWIEKCYTKKEEELSLKDFKSWAGKYFSSGIERHTQQSFVENYGHLVSENVLRLIMENSLPSFAYKQELHINA